MSNKLKVVEKNIVSVREIQRHYRRLLEEVKKKKIPLYLGTRAKPEAVLIDLQSFEELSKKAQQKMRPWEEIKKNLERLRAAGRQDINLAKFIREDRRRH